MASLDLVPNPTILAIQTGVFLANLVVVKKLLLEPYLKVRKQREELTLGGQEKARQLELDNEKKLQAIQTRLYDASERSRQQVEAILAKASAERDRIIKEAELAAKKTVVDSQRLVEAELTAERQKVPAIISSLTQELYGKTVS